MKTMSCRKKTPLQNPEQHQFHTNLQKTSQQRTRWQTEVFFSSSRKTMRVGKNNTLVFRHLSSSFCQYLKHIKANR